MPRRIPPLDGLDEATRLHRAASALQRWMHDSRSPGSIGTSKLWALAILQRDGPSTAGAIAAELGVQPQSMTRLLADLQARGAIVRHQDATDRRRVDVAITRAGTTLLLSEARAQRERLARVMQQRLTHAERGILSVAADLMLRLTRVADPPASQTRPAPGRGAER